MGLITGITYPNNGDRIKVSDYNPTIQTIIAMLNGNLGSENVTAGSLPWEVMASFTNKIPATAMQDSGNLEKYIDEEGFDYVASGCVWTGDSYAVNRNASMTAGVVRINGKRIAISAVTARAFTASKDTYVDIGVDGVIDYNEVANNVASPALATDHMRIAIIVTGATTIAAVGSVNQGQEDKVLPIASSIAYAVTDSLGNLICPRDPNRRILGYRQVIANQSGIGAADLTGLSVSVLVPTGRKVKITGSGDFTNTNTSTFTELSIKEGATTLNKSNHAITGAGTHGSAFVQRPLTPTTSGLHTYKLGAAVFSGTGTLIATADAPAFICVELA